MRTDGSAVGARAQGAHHDTPRSLHASLQLMDRAEISDREDALVGCNGLRNGARAHAETVERHATAVLGPHDATFLTCIRLNSVGNAANHAQKRPARGEARRVDLHHAQLLDDATDHVDTIHEFHRV